jgi:hypothetical protein
MSRWLKKLGVFDHMSRVHLRVFSRQVAFLSIFSSPAILFDDQRPHLFLSMIRTMFALSALIVFGVAFLARQPLNPTSLCLWDHVPAMLLLAIACLMGLWMLP